MVINEIGFAKSYALRSLNTVDEFVRSDPKVSNAVSWYEDNIKYSELEDGCCNEVYGNGAIEWRTSPKIKCVGVGVVSEAKVLMCGSIKAELYYNDGKRALVCTKKGYPLKVADSPRLYSRNFISVLKDVFKNKIKPMSFKGGIALLGQGGGELSPRNYYHFWTDVVGDLWHIRKILPASEIPHFYLVNFCGLPWQWDILKMCGLKEEQVIPYSRQDFFNAENLVISFRDKGATNLPHWLSTAIHEMSGWKRRSKPGSRRIFISRADASRRLIVNEDILREHLCRLGFEVYVLDGMSVKQQQELFSSASVICSPHGAALTNLVWCGSGTVIIDLLSEGHLVPCFKELSKQNKLIYFPVVCEKANKNVNGLSGDVRLSQEQFESILSIINQQFVPSNYELLSKSGV